MGISLVEITKSTPTISPTLKLVNGEGRPTSEFMRFLRAALEIIDAVNIVPGEITEEELADLAVSAAKLQDSAVVIGKLAAGSIHVSTLFADEVVITSKVAQNAITLGAAANGADATVALADGEVELISEDITITNGGDVTILFNSLATSVDSNFPETDYRLKRNGTVLLTKRWAVDDEEGVRDTILNYVDTPGNGTHTYSVTAELIELTGVAHTNVYIQLLNLKR